jgi:hypothetical protein
VLGHDLRPLGDRALDELAESLFRGLYLPVHTNSLDCLDISVNEMWPAETR